jgi:dTDP-4-dehydrorhamnose reductase
MAVILVTGANGQLGSELKELTKSYYGYHFIFTDADTLDITNSDATEDYIRKCDPGWIINCAAYNLVDKAEKEPDKAMLVNSTAVTNIVKAIKGGDCRLIHFSSDYVFDGKSNQPYNELSPTNPLGAYGRSKLEGEKAAISYYASMVIRTSWLYSSYGSNFIKTIINMGIKTGNVKVVYDQVGSPTYAADLANAVMTIISGVIRNQYIFQPGLYHYANEGVCSRYDLAVEALREAGVDCEVTPLLSKDYLTDAVRPAYSVLDKSKIRGNYSLSIPQWRSSLKKCVKQILI